jgi:protein-tyrosine phosphatase
VDSSVDFERLISLSGATNFRDVGGYETVDGRRTRWRTLFRADGLSRLTDEDLTVIDSLHIATVIDLRTSYELELGKFPVERIPVGFHHFPLLDEMPDPDRFKIVPGMLAKQYKEMARDAAGQIAGAIKLLVEQGTLPAVIHCTAGKDRTGLVMAIVLSLLGVPEQTVVEDYAKSAAAMTRLRASLIARYPEGRATIEEADEMFAAHPEYMAGLLEDLQGEFGSIVGYAEQTGIGPDVVLELQQALLEPAA